MPGLNWLVVGLTAIPVGSGSLSMNVVRVNATGAGGAQASPYNASPFDLVIVDLSLGNVVVNLPVLSTAQLVQVTHDSKTAIGAATCTINGPAGVQIAQPPPNNGTFAASFVFPNATAPAADCPGLTNTWFNGGSAGGYLLQ